MVMITKNCRLCGSPKLKEVLSLGNQYINDFPDSVTKTASPGTNTSWGTLCPITLVQCEDCDMLQAGYTAPNQLLYSRKYWFKSGTNASVVANLKDIAKEVIELAQLKKDDVVLSIGENDGTLL